MDSDSNQTILVVDDDIEICNLLQEYLQKHQMQVVTAHNGTQMMQCLQQHRIDLIVLDIMMPGSDGFELCQQLRKTNQTPIIMLTAGSDETDRIIGLELGADDYMTKPFNPRELLARIKAVLRRGDTSASEIESLTYSFGDWQLSVESRSLKNKSGDIMPLNGAEFELLQLFIKHPGKVLSRDELSNHLKGRESFPFDRSIDVQISRLRNRLNDSGKYPQLIKTVRGAGYILATHVETE